MMLTKYLTAAALAAAAPLAALAQDGVKSFGSSGNAAMFGVAGSIDEAETEGAPAAVGGLVTALSDDTMPDIAWNAVSRVTELETVPLSSLDGDPAQAGLDAALDDARDDLASIRAAITDNPAAATTLQEAGFAPEAVIAVFGAAKSTVEMVVDDRI